MYLTEVVKVIFVMHPSVVGSQAVGLVGDVLHVEAGAVVELAFEQLRHTHARTHADTHQSFSIKALVVAICFSEVLP